MGNLGVPELLIIAGVIVLLFGSKKLPEMARSLGKSAKALKEETQGLRGGDTVSDTKSDTEPARPPSQPSSPQPPAPAPDGTRPAEQVQPDKTAG